jgi:DNA-binding transcriptional regulator YdaS (Cro superfamily)
MTSKTVKEKNSIAQAAINWAGTQIELGKRIGCSQATVSQWLNTGQLDAEIALRLQKVSRGKFKAKQIRPELF